MSAHAFEITTPWGDAFLAGTSAEARRVACVSVFSTLRAHEDVAEEAYEALTAQEGFGLWRMLEGMGAKMRRVPVPEGAPCA